MRLHSKIYPIVLIRSMQFRRGRKSDWFSRMYHIFSFGIEKVSSASFVLLDCLFLALSSVFFAFSSKMKPVPSKGEGHSLDHWKFVGWKIVLRQFDLCPVPSDFMVVHVPKLREAILPPSWPWTRVHVFIKLMNCTSASSLSSTRFCGDGANGIS